MLRFGCLLRPSLRQTPFLNTGPLPKCSAGFPGATRTLGDDRIAESTLMTEVAFSIGGSTYERIEVAVSGYERQPSGDHYDDNWLRAEVSLAVGSFSGRFQASFLASELLEFRDQLATLHKNLDGEANLITLESQLLLCLTGNGRGGISLKGEALDQAGIGNRLVFGLDFDQTHLPATIEKLDTVIERFPVRAG